MVPGNSFPILSLQVKGLYPLFSHTSLLAAQASTIRITVGWCFVGGGISGPAYLAFLVLVHISEDSWVATGRSKLPCPSLSLIWCNWKAPLLKVIQGFPMASDCWKLCDSQGCLGHRHTVRKEHRGMHRRWQTSPSPHPISQNSGPSTLDYKGRESCGHN